MEVLFQMFLFILGVCFGSFLCCQARRLHRKEKKQKPLGNRSVCNHCRYRLKWYDNLPIISWLALRGRCRKCHKKIGLAEILAELGTAIAFVMLGTTINLTATTPLGWATFVVTLIFTLIIIFLAIYDGLYGELPTLILIFAIIFAIITLILKNWASLSVFPFSPGYIIQPLLSVAILGGLYLILYLISKGKWVGDGDWLLAIAIGIALAHPWLALIALFLANFSACIIMLPTIKSKKNHHIHFGPFLSLAYIITITFADFFLSMI